MYINFTLNLVRSGTLKCAGTRGIKRTCKVSAAKKKHWNIFQLIRFTAGQEHDMQREEHLWQGSLGSKAEQGFGKKKSEQCGSV